MPPESLPLSSLFSRRFAIAAAVALGAALGVCGCADLQSRRGAAAARAPQEGRGSLWGTVADVAGGAGELARTAGEAIAPANPVLGGALFAGGSLVTLGASWARRRLIKPKHNRRASDRAQAITTRAGFARALGDAASYAAAAITAPKEDPATPADWGHYPVPSAAADTARPAAPTPAGTAPTSAQPKQRRQPRRAQPAPTGPVAVSEQSNRRAAA